MIDYLNQFDDQLEIDNGAIECPTVDASSLRYKLEQIAEKKTAGDYFSNIVESFCTVNGLHPRDIAASFHI